MKIKITKLDRLFSLYKRLMSGGICMRCGKYFGVEKLHNAHFHSRRKHTVRWDKRNTAPLCYGCHSYIDGNPLEKVEFFLTLLGQKEFDRLNEIANMTTKDYPIDKDKLEEEFKEAIRRLE